ncbi:MAG TPA: helix-turn-helix domain-containing protein [Solirubrobacterales bacterium]|nr:helix-turn-helix domain-containing protein [Solirubrobacterales bacterium]
MTEQSADATRETRMMKALSHPLRWRILEALMSGPASPSVIAAELGEPLGNVSYHVKILLQYDAIELVETRPVRGALEHVYRAIERPFLNDAQWAKLPLAVRRDNFNNTLNGAWEHLVEAAKSGGLDAETTHISWTKLDLDQQAYDELTEILSDTLHRALELHAESAGRAVEGADGDDSKTHRTELTIFHYHRAPAGR